MERKFILYGFVGIFLLAFVGEKQKEKIRPVTLFLCGDVMLGRGIDQALPYPSDPVLYETYVKNAKGYLNLAEKRNGIIPHPVSFSYVWGDALEELERVMPDVRLINLETSITTSEEYWKRKGINYRMNPKNIDCLVEAKIDYCSLANNHVMDWGFTGLDETMQSLKKAKIRFGGAGSDRKAAEDPVVLETPGKGRIIVYSCCYGSSGVPFDWGARDDQHGVNLLNNLSERTVLHIKEKIEKVKQEGDIVVVSIHWGGNWGYQIPAAHGGFAYKLIDEAGVDVIHGHSSHHVLGIEVYRNKPIIYGCGDFLNDYEGISGNEKYRDDLGLMYFLSMDPVNGKLLSLQMVPTQIKRFKVNRASYADAKWLQKVLNREGKALGTSVRLDKENRMWLEWD
ncbi:MAG: CapA family protein [Marinifilaceae bacterium]